MLPAIRVEKLSKRYRIHSMERRGKDLRDSLAELLTSPIRRLRYWNESLYKEEETIWALKDVSFDVPQGEVVGLIGKNGAGKSTLLKILSRITEPTSGRAEIHGRLGTILEVSTGFHPELTGRDNVFLAGAHRGMRRREIARKFDEIVDFSEIGRFIDTPVKRYSSGMQVRLAFAVAVSLNSEVLLLDEVLAVGDISFKNKCMAKMEELARGGRTVLLVSHSMKRIGTLSHRILVFDKGELAFYGDPDEAFKVYDRILAEDAIQQAALAISSTAPKVVLAPGSDPARLIVGVETRNQYGAPAKALRSGDPIRFVVQMDLGELSLDNPLVVLTIKKGDAVVSHLLTRQLHSADFALAGTTFAVCDWNPGKLGPGTYTIDAVLKTAKYRGERLCRQLRIASFEITAEDADPYEMDLLREMILMPQGTWAFPNRAREAG